MHDYGWAVAEMKAGRHVRRRGWNGHGMWLGLSRPMPGCNMTQWYIYMCTTSQDLVPWVASHSDMLAEDWEQAQ